MKELELYGSLVATILGLLVTTVTFVLKFIKSAKGKKIASALLRITNEIIPYIEEAEKFVHYSGIEKKAYVMTKVREFIYKQRIKVEDDKINEVVEQLVELTKKVNYQSSGNVTSLQTHSKKELKKLYEEEV